jgi:2-polyprenyl-3-methyl-5-hydroxy-6-metoxy-1,4-benzoquinol methylase
VTLETVEHLDDPLQYLRSIHDRLAPSGMLIASVPTTVSTDGNPYHLVDFTVKSWRKMVGDAGFVIEHELAQAQRFTLRDVIGSKRGARQQVQRSLIRYYLKHPRVAAARVVLTLTKGLVNEYLVVAARRR